MLSFFFEYKHKDSPSFSQIENKLPDGFCDIFMSLHSYLTSSGAIERMFSTFGIVWSAVRNRFGDKAHKLVQIYTHLLKIRVQQWLIF